MPEIEFHEVADIFPLLPNEELNALAEDIRVNGQREKITTRNGKIVDGRNRYRACQLAGIEPQFEEWDGSGSLVTFVVSRNMHRRHLNESQRGMAALALEKVLAVEAENRQKRPENGLRVNFPNDDGAKGKSSDQAAAVLNVSGKTVRAAKKVATEAEPEIAAAVVNGDVSVSDAASIAKQPAPVQRAALKAVTSGKASTLAKAVAEAPKKPAKGKPTVDVRDFEKISTQIGSIVRSVDELAHKCPGDKFAREIRNSLDVCLRNLKDWRKAGRVS